MKYVITQQIAVEAENVQEAVAKMSEGQTISISVAARPAPPQQVPARRDQPVSVAG